MVESFLDWEKLFGQAAPLLPLDIDPTFLEERPTVLRRLFVDLTPEVVTALGQRTDRTQDPLRIFADVIRIAEPILLPVDTDLHARRIEIGSTAALTMEPGVDGDSEGEAGSSPACELTISADEWVTDPSAPSQTLSLQIGGVTHLLTDAFSGGAFRATVAEDGAVEIRELSHPLGLDDELAQAALTAAKRVGYRSDDNQARDIALSMCSWIRRTTQNPVVNADAQAFARALTSPTGPAFPVPLLRLKSYKELAKSTRDALVTVEQKWERLQGREVDVRDRKGAASDVLEQLEHAAKLTRRLIEQAQDNADAALADTTRAQDRIEERRDELDELRAEFDAGVDAFKAKATRDAVFAAVTGIAAVAAAAAATVATAGAAAPAAGAAAASTAAAIKGTADTIEALRKIAEFVKKLGEILDAMKPILEYAAKLSALLAVIDDAERAVEAARSAQQAPEPIGEEAFLTSADWREFVANLDVAFQPARDEGIDGADEYYLGLKKLAIRGEHLVETQQELSRSQQALARALWQKLRDDADLVTMQTRIDALTDSVAHVGPLMIFHAQLRDRLKYRLLSAIEDMSDVYRYLTLREPAQTPDLTADAGGLAAAISDVESALVIAQEDMNQPGTWRDRLTISAEGPLRQLQRTRELRLAVPIDSDLVEHYDRVRISDLKVWIQGAPPGESVYAEITTSGTYADRLQGRTMQFSTKPLFWTFEYEPNPRGPDRDWNGDPVRIIKTVATNEFDYFSPSIFTTWTIRIPQRGNTIELDDVESVTLAFEGSVSSSPRRMAGSAAAEDNADFGISLVGDEPTIEIDLAKAMVLL